MTEHQDDTNQLDALFAASRGGVVTLPPGDYFLSGERPIALHSGTTVLAYGARFHLPQTLGDGARVVLFEGVNVSDFRWMGGTFIGRCFDHRRPGSTWEPNVSTRALVFRTTRGGETRNLTFRDIAAKRVAGAVVTVGGVGVAGSESAVETYAANVTVQDCTLVESGKFMWDYGLLWQILVWPEDYTHADVAMARRYFRNDLVRDGLAMADGDDRVFFDNAGRRIGVSGSTDARHAVCFFGDTLPRNVVRGRQYFVVDAAPGFIRIAERSGGAPLRFDGAAGPEARLIHDLHSAFLALYAPTGQGPGKGGVDLVCCENVTVTGCKLSALGDTMHIQRCRNVVFANNHILGSRMGAFFLAEYCRNSTVTGNVVDGTNGSRVMSVEKSNEDVTIVGNTFRGGGRGSWINQPKGLVMQGNIFANNTTKGEADPWRGRRCFQTGQWERYPELYFTLHEPDGAYGPVILRDNLFVTGPEASSAVHFASGGHDILVDGNIFQGATGAIVLPEDRGGFTIGSNPGADT